MSNTDTDDPTAFADLKARSVEVWPILEHELAVLMGIRMFLNRLPQLRDDYESESDDDHECERGHFSDCSRGHASESENDDASVVSHASEGLFILDTDVV
jgi:hypothetical protein